MMSAHTFGSLAGAVVLVVGWGAVLWWFIVAAHPEATRAERERAFHVYRDGFPANQHDLDRMKPSAKWLAAWERAGSPDDWPRSEWPRDF